MKFNRLINVDPINVCNKDFSLHYFTLTAFGLILIMDKIYGLYRYYTKEPITAYSPLLPN